MKKYIPLYRKCHNGSDEIIHVNDSEIFLYYIVALYEFYFIPHIVCGKLGIQYNFTYCDLSQIFICKLWMHLVLNFNRTPQLGSHLCCPKYNLHLELHTVTRECYLLFNVLTTSFWIKINEKLMHYTTSLSG